MGVSFFSCHIRESLRVGLTPAHQILLQKSRAFGSARPPIVDAIGGLLLYHETPHAGGVVASSRRSAWRRSLISIV